MKVNSDIARKIILFVILILLIFYVIKGKNDSGITYEPDGTYTTEENLEPKSFLTKDTLIILFYLLLVFIFRKSLNISNPNIKAAGRISLMIVSAYFSYLSFVTLKLPEFIAIIGGMGFVIGVVEASANWKKYRIASKLGKKDRIVLFYLGVMILSTLLDISMTAINFVTIEGKYVITQKMFAEKRKIEQSRADEKALKLIESLTASGNYANARLHSENYFKVREKEQNNVDNKAEHGYIMSGFTDLLGSEKAGRIGTNIFILLVSCGITLLMISFNEIDDYVGASNETDNVKSLAGDNKKPQVNRASKGASNSASASKEIDCNVAMKDAIRAQLDVQEKGGRVNKSAIARQMQVIYGKCSRQYVQQVDDERKKKQIGFGVNRNKVN